MDRSRNYTNDTTIKHKGIPFFNYLKNTSTEPERVLFELILLTCVDLASNLYPVRVSFLFRDTVMLTGPVSGK